MAESVMKRLQNVLDSFVSWDFQRQRAWSLCLANVVAQLNAKPSAQRKTSPFDMFRSRRNTEFYNIFPWKMGAKEDLTEEKMQELITTVVEAKGVRIKKMIAKSRKKQKPGVFKKGDHVFIILDKKQLKSKYQLMFNVKTIKGYTRKLK